MPSINNKSPYAFRRIDCSLVECDFLKQMQSSAYKTSNKAAAANGGAQMFLNGKVQPVQQEKNTQLVCINGKCYSRKPNSKHLYKLH